MKTGELEYLKETLDVLSRRWNLLIIFILLSGPKRFSEIKSLLGKNISSKSLSTALKSLIEYNFVEKRKGKNPSKYSNYYLTYKGRQLEDVYKSLVRWSKVHGSSLKRNDENRVKNKM